MFFMHSMKATKLGIVRPSTFPILYSVDRDVHSYIVWCDNPVNNTTRRDTPSSAKM